jgi:Domain of Unknown Function (DUF349)
MSFLDRFKPQPRWKHADPTVRAAAVAEIPDDAEHQRVLEELAQEDDDVRVRRAASARVTDVAVLVALARSERDGELRREVTDRLVEIAIAPAETDGDAALALDGLDDQKQLASVAKASPHDTVRTAALGRIHDGRVLGSVARQAADPVTALEAAARVADPAELLNIALKTEHKDAGIAALERLVDPAAAPPEARETLEGIATRAKSKSVVKRARAIIQAIDDAAAARRAALEHWQQRVASVLARVEALAASPRLGVASSQLADAEAQWRELSAEGTFEMDQDTTARFGALVDRARTGIEEHERAEAERRAEEERRAAVRAAQLSVCQRVEAAGGEDALEAVERARAEGEGLAAGEQERADAEIVARFEDACRAARQRHDNFQERQRIHARLEELATDAERIVGAEPLNTAAWDATTAEWRTLLPRATEIDPAIQERFNAADARLQRLHDERRAAADRARRQQLQRIDQLIDRVHKRATAEDLTLREADRAVRELRTAIEAPAIEIDEREHHVLVERLKVALSVMSPRLHELREMDEWKRFANAAVQEELIAQAEALRTKYGFENPDGPKEEDVEKAAKELHDIQERWKTVAEAPRAQAQALWHRYRQAADPIQTKAREFFARRSEERKGNLERKLALIQRAEELASSTDWIKTAEELKKLQAEWQQIGPVPRQETRDTWKRFREACDQFFTRRNADLAQRKETWSANLARKEALCARAEELATSTEWERAAAEIRRLQADWKNVGPVRRNKSEAIWQRFRTACDTFFDRYKRRDEIEIQAKQADREGLVSELEALVPQRADGEAAAATSAPEGLLDRVRSLRSRWNQTTPVVRQGADPLSGRFVGALEQLLIAYPDAFRGSELDVEANRQKMEKLAARVEGYVSEAGAATPAAGSQALAAMLREALAANTIGGRAGEESKWRALGEEVRQAQNAWARLGPVPGEAGRALGDRFHRACNRFFDLYRRKVPAQPQRGGRPVGAR